MSADHGRSAKSVWRNAKHTETGCEIFRSERFQYLQIVSILAFNTLLPSRGPSWPPELTGQRPLDPPLRWCWLEPNGAQMAFVGNHISKHAALRKNQNCFHLYVCVIKFLSRKRKVKVGKSLPCLIHPGHLNVRLLDQNESILFRPLGQRTRLNSYYQ